jgi:hypothetical protein
MRQIAAVYKLPFLELASFQRFFFGELLSEGDVQLRIKKTGKEEVEVELHAEASTVVFKMLRKKMQSGWWSDFTRYLKPEVVQSFALFVLPSSQVSSFFQAFGASELCQNALACTFPVPNTSSIEVLISVPSFASFLLTSSIEDGLLSKHKEFLECMILH